MEVERYLKVKESLKDEQLRIIRPNIDNALFLIEIICGENDSFCQNEYQGLSLG